MVPVSVKGTEFIRMFLMHVLPKGFVRIRHYGLLSCRNKKEKMTLCRNLLGCEQYISRLRDTIKLQQKRFSFFIIEIFVNADTAVNLCIPIKFLVDICFVNKSKLIFF